MTNPGISMWNGSSKIHNFKGFFCTLSVGGCGGHGCNFQPNPKVTSKISASQRYTNTVFMTQKCISDAE